MIAIRLSPANRDRIRASIPATVLPDEDLTAMVEEYGNRPQDRAIYFTPAYEFPAPHKERSSWGTIPGRFMQEFYTLEEPVDSMNYKFVTITRK